MSLLVKTIYIKLKVNIKLWKQKSFLEQWNVFILWWWKQKYTHSLCRSHRGRVCDMITMREFNDHQYWNKMYTSVITPTDASFDCLDWCEKTYWCETEARNLRKKSWSQQLDESMRSPRLPAVVFHSLLVFLSCISASSFCISNISFFFFDQISTISQYTNMHRWNWPPPSDSIYWWSGHEGWICCCDEKYTTSGKYGTT